MATASHQHRRHLLQGLVVFLVGGLLVQSAGCVTTSRFEELQSRVAELELERTRLRAAMDEDVQRLENLHGKLTEAEETLRRSGANLGIRMENAEARLAKIAGELEAIAFRMKGLRHGVAVIKRVIAERLGTTAIYLPGDLPEDPDGIWQRAEELREADDLPEAKAVYDYFEASFPDDPRAPEALMHLAAMTGADGDASGAIKRYQRVADQYPDADTAPAALWRIVELLSARGDCKRAKGVMGYLEREYRDSDEARRADDEGPALLKSCREE